MAVTLGQRREKLRELVHQLLEGDAGKNVGSGSLRDALGQWLAVSAAGHGVGERGWLL
jgi:hypothetical protein